MSTKEIKVGTKFFYGGTHTINAIDNFGVYHSYTYTNAKGDEVEVRDGFMYRSVFDKLVATNVIIIL